MTLFFAMYFSTIRGLLECCAPLFAGISATDSSRLERLQKRFHKLLCGTLCMNNCLPNLSTRRECQTMCFFKKMRSPSHILNFLFPTISNRSVVVLSFLFGTLNVVLVRLYQKQLFLLIISITTDDFNAFSTNFLFFCVTLRVSIYQLFLQKACKFRFSFMKIYNA